MPSIFKTRFALRFIATIAFSSLLPLHQQTTASPVPNSPAYTDSFSVAPSSTFAQNLSDVSLVHETQTARSRSTDLLTRAQSPLRSHYVAATRSNAEFNQLSQQAPRFSNNAAFGQDCLTQLTAFQGNVDSFQSLLAGSGSDKGLKNFNPSCADEELLREIIDLHKDTLQKVSEIVDNFPVLNKLLGPLVDQVKCLLDDVLDGVEDITDLLLGTLGLCL